MLLSRKKQIQPSRETVFPLQNGMLVRMRQEDNLLRDWTVTVEYSDPLEKLKNISTAEEAEYIARAMVTKYEAIENLLQD